MALLLTEIRYGLLAQARNPRARVMTLAFPLILLVVLVGLASSGATTIDGDQVALRRFFLGGILAMSMAAACYGALVAVVVSARETGAFKRRRATPTPAWVVVAGQVATTLVVALATAALLLAVARVVYGVGVPAGGLAAVAVLVVLGGAALAAVAFAVASVVPNVDAVQPAVQLTLLPLYFISGIWFSTDDLPDWLRRVAEALPLEPLAHALHLATLRGRLDGGDLAVLGIWAAGGLFVAARRFSWLPRAAAAA
jgi:ABC-2 type transport system permease protein